MSLLRGKQAFGMTLNGLLLSVSLPVGISVGNSRPVRWAPPIEDSGSDASRPWDKGSNGWLPANSALALLAYLWEASCSCADTHMARSEAQRGQAERTEASSPAAGEEVTLASNQVREPGAGSSLKMTLAPAWVFTAALVELRVGGPRGAASRFRRQESRRLWDSNFVIANGYYKFSPTLCNFNLLNLAVIFYAAVKN